MLLYQRMLTVMYIPLLIKAAPLKGCNRPSLPDDSYIYKGPTINTADGQRLRVSCKEEYKEDYPYITCQNGRWSHPEPRCIPVRCLFPYVPAPPGSMNAPCRRFNCTATYRCPEEKWYTGTVERVCQRNETWSGGAGHCEAVKCPELSFPQNGQVLQPNRSYMANATIQCDEGYIYSGPGVMRCQKDNTWSGQIGTCNRKPCPTITEDGNGKLSSNSGVFEDVITLQCNRGYYVEGPGSVTCGGNGMWSAAIGLCKRSKENDDNVKPYTMLASVIAGGIAIVTVTVLCLCWHQRRQTGNLINEERDELTPLMATEKLYCSFILADDFSKEYTNPESPEYQQFANCLKTEITEALISNLCCDVRVAVTSLCQKSRTVFIYISSTQYTSQKKTERAILGASFRFNHSSYSIVPGSVTFRDCAIHHIVADVYRRRHVTDKHLDKTIDLDEQYISLKLLKTETMGIMHRDTLERPDHYQHDLGQQEGDDIKDQDLIKVHEINKFILIRGRAGIGKTTLVQRLLWRWANREWATKFKLFILLNLRYLMHIEKRISLPKLLSLYGVYTTRNIEILIDADWLNENQSNIGLILDGIDEVQNFKEYWKREDETPTMDGDTDPLKWCFHLMKRNILNYSTLIVISRPFADLNLIGSSLQTSMSSKHLMMVELMGLTRDKVFEFVNRNAPEFQRKKIKNMLERNPILLSVCAITFYCAALCHVLGEADVTTPILTTYTMITAYIIQVYIKRSMKKDRKTVICTEEISPILAFLSRLAMDGFSHMKPGELPKLVFTQSDLQKLSEGPENLLELRQLGLLMETGIPDPEKPEDNMILWQFVHLSIQEFLAMVGLLEESPERMTSILGPTMKHLSQTGQFNMALLFLYGIAFDEGNSPVTYTSKSLKRSAQSQFEIKKVLSDTVSCVSNELQALQIAHESQSKDLVEKIGKEHFKDEIKISSTKLTAIDMIAITFLLKHNPSLQCLRLQYVGIDITSVQELATLLGNNNCLRTLELWDNSLDDTCIEALMKGLEQNTSLKTLELRVMNVTDKGVEAISHAMQDNKNLERVSLTFHKMTDKGVINVAKTLPSNKLQHLVLTSVRMTDHGVKAVADALRENRSIKELSLSSNCMTDRGVQQLSAALMANSCLQQLTLCSDGITSEGVAHVSRMLAESKHLTEVSLDGLHIDENGAEYILQALRENHKVNIWLLRCWYKANVVNELEAIDRIHLLSQ